MTTIAPEKGRKLPLNFRKTALIAIDLQKIFIDEKSPAYIPFWKNAERNTKKLIELSINKDIPVVFTKHVHPMNDDGGVLGHFFGRLLHEDDPLSELADWTSEYSKSLIFRKNTHAAFSDNLPEVLHGIDTAILIGVQTQLCVLATAIDLARYGIIPIVAVDACASPKIHMHEAAITTLSSAHAHIMTSDEIVAQLVEQNEKVYDFMIIGAGPAGISAAIQAKRDGLSVCIISSEKAGGLVKAANRIDNLPGFPDGISGKAYADLLLKHCKKFEVKIIEDTAVKIEARETFLIKAENDEFEAHNLLVATGTRPKKYFFDDDSENYHRDARSFPADFEKARIAIIGGGETALDAAIYASKLNAQVSVFVRSGELKGTEYLLTEIEKLGTDVYLETQVKNIELVKNGYQKFKLTTFIYDMKMTSSFEHLLVSIGRKPNSDLLDDILHTETIPNSVQTEIPGLFVAGDLIQGINRFVASAIGDGQKAARYALQRTIKRREIHGD